MSSSYKLDDVTYVSCITPTTEAGARTATPKNSAKPSNFGIKMF